MCLTLYCIDIERKSVMKVITFNIRCCDDPNGNSIEERAPRLKTVLEKYDADIVGFQEATPLWIEKINAYFGTEYTIFNKYRALENLESCPLMWKTDKFDLIDSGYFWLSDTPWIESFGNDSECDCLRICEWVFLREKATGKSFHYFNTHFGFENGYQIASADLLKKTADLLKSENVIITGDFNAEPDSDCYARMTEYFGDANVVTGAECIDTFHSYGTESKRIDYIFINENIDVKSYQVIDDLVEGKYPSDHYGAMIKFGIR